MNIGLLAHNSKKSLMEDFCLAYKKILEKHELYATGTTGRRIEEVTKLHVHKFLPGSIGGENPQRCAGGAAAQRTAFAGCGGFAGYGAQRPGKAGISSDYP